MIDKYYRLWFDNTGGTMKRIPFAICALDPSTDQQLWQGGAAEFGGPTILNDIGTAMATAMQAGSPYMAFVEVEELQYVTI